MTRPSSLEQIKSFLQIDDEAVKTNCFKLLHNLLCRTFDKPAQNDWNSVSSAGPFSPNKETSKSDEHELQEIKTSARDDIFQFVSPIIQNVIVFELSLTNGTPSTEKELKITEIIGS